MNQDYKELLRRIGKLAMAVISIVIFVLAVYYLCIDEYAHSAALFGFYLAGKD